MNPTVNPTFQKLIPPLAPEEFAQLEANIIADGCRDPLVVWNGTLIDGHNRLAICQKREIKFATKAIKFETEDEACVWIIRNQFGRRNLAPFTRVELALKLEPLLRVKAKENYDLNVGRPKSGKNSAPITCPLCLQIYDGNKGHICRESRKTRAELSKIAGVSHDTITKGKLVAEHADDATKHKLRTNQVSIHRVAKDIKESRQKKARQEKRSEAAKTAPASDDRIIVGDFRKSAGKVADGSLSLIFTDPPYDREASKMLPDLAVFAKSKLAEGGSLLCYVGQTQIPAALDAFRKDLKYLWTVACVHAAGETIMREYGIRCGWKAVLWFVKGSRDDNSVFVSDVMSGGKEKSHHDWQQAESEASYWIEKLCPKDGIVCDPFLGGGTTAAAAKSLGRDWIGFEIDPDTAKIASGRVAK